MSLRVDTRRRLEGYALLAAFALCIPLANWMIGNVGTSCVADGPCTIPVGFGLAAPSGVIVAGLALVLRDLVQRRLGLRWAIVAVLGGGILSGAVAPPALVIASVAAFLFSEFADLAVYTPLQKRGLVKAVVLSSLVGLLVDTVLFLHLAFGSLDYMWGQLVGKSWMVLLAIPFISYLRRRDDRLTMYPQGITT